MSREGVAAFLTQVMEDEAFRNQLKASPDATLTKFDLTPDEVAAIKSADPSKIQELGVDERVSKTATPDSMILDASEMGNALANVPWAQLPTILRHIFHP